MMTTTMNDAVAQFQRSVDEFLQAFGEFSDWWATLEGKWPDRFVLLNRYLRTGQEPPFIFND